MNRHLQPLRPTRTLLLLWLAPLLLAALPSDVENPVERPMQLAGPADLIAELSLSQQMAPPEANHSVRVAIENAGSSFASSFVNRVRLSSDAQCDLNDDLLLSLNSDGLAAGARIEFARNIATPAATEATEVHLCWQVDANEDLIESDETNNLAQALLVLIPGLVATDGFESGDFSAWSPLDA